MAAQVDSATDPFHAPSRILDAILAERPALRMRVQEAADAIRESVNLVVPPSIDAGVMFRGLALERLANEGHDYARALVLAVHFAECAISFAAGPDELVMRPLIQAQTKDSFSARRLLARFESVDAAWRLINASTQAEKLDKLMDEIEIFAASAKNDEEWWAARNAEMSAPRPGRPEELDLVDVAFDPKAWEKNTPPRSVKLLHAWWPGTGRVRRCRALKEHIDHHKLFAVTARQVERAYERREKRNKGKPPP